MGIWSEKVEKISSGKEKSTILSLFYHCKRNGFCIKNRKMLQKNTKTQDFQEIGEDIFVKDTFLAVFVQKSGRTVTFLYEIGYFMGIYENT